MAGIGKVPKMASANIKTTDNTPLFAWIRDKLLAVKRDPRTPPPGIPAPDGEARYNNPCRFPSSQSVRSPEPALAQGGVYHKIADNYYYERDERRKVLPPTPIYKVDQTGHVEVKIPSGEPISLEQFKDVAGINKGPEVNYGLSSKIPTPGNGYEWARSIQNEEWSQQKDPEFRNTINT